MKTDFEKQDVIMLARSLYHRLPFWKRWSILKWYRKNNWDVSGEWRNCVRTANKMHEDAMVWLKD